ncbi:hypothetical protein L9F63_005502, partial [Diploptera punctata]
LDSQLDQLKPSVNRDSQLDSMCSHLHRIIWLRIKRSGRTTSAGQDVLHLKGSITEEMLQLFV